MKLITFYTPQYEGIAEITVPRWKLYCNAHGIEFECFKMPQIGRRVDFCWDKIELCKTVFSGVDDYLVWVDVDTLLLKLEPSPFDFLKYTDRPMIISSDDNGVCTGFFILRKCAWTIQYLETLIFLGNIITPLEIQLQTVNAGDQSCAKYLLGCENVIKNTFVIDDDGVITHPNRGIQKNTFLYHYWANGGPECRYRIVDQMQKAVQQYPLS